MTQYNTLNVKLSNLQLNKLKSDIKNNTEVNLKTSSNVADDSNDENNFLHKLLLINTQVSKHRKANTQVSKLRKSFANNFSTNIKLSKTQLHKIGQSGEFLGTHLGPLFKAGLPLIGNVLKPLAKSVLIQLGLTAVATNLAIHKMFGSETTTLIISNEEMKDIMKTINSLEESGLLIKVVSEKNKRRISWNVIRHFMC